jgi:hypothetical protein
LSQLLANPVDGGRLGHGPIENFSAVVPDDHKHVEHLESNRGNGEEIHACQNLTMQLEKPLPALDRIGTRGVREIARNSALRHVEAKSQQFAVNAWCAPGRIFCDDLANQTTQLGIDLRTSWRFAAGTPTPFASFNDERDRRCAYVVG